jgi:hypothetical protein
MFFAQPADRGRRRAISRCMGRACRCGRPPVAQQNPTVPGRLVISLREEEACSVRLGDVGDLFGSAVGGLRAASLLKARVWKSANVG